MYNKNRCFRIENYDVTNYQHLKNVQAEALKHLNETHLAYFIHWSSLLTLESKVRTDLKSLHEVFTVDAATRLVLFLQKNTLFI